MVPITIYVYDTYLRVSEHSRRVTWFVILAWHRRDREIFSIPTSTWKKIIQERFVIKIVRETKKFVTRCHLNIESMPSSDIELKGKRIGPTFFVKRLCSYLT